MTGWTAIIAMGLGLAFALFLINEVNEIIKKSLKDNE